MKTMTTRALIHEAKQNGECSDCGGTFPSEALDFDHVPERGSKAFNLNHPTAGASLDAVRAEIAKCDLVCAGCHRIRTRARSLADGTARREREAEARAADASALLTMTERAQRLGLGRRDGNLAPCLNLLLRHGMVEAIDAAADESGEALTSDLPPAMVSWYQSRWDAVCLWRETGQVKWPPSPEGWPPKVSK
jgi:hypothetical protein